VLFNLIYIYGTTINVINVFGERGFKLTARNLQRVIRHRLIVIAFWNALAFLAGYRANKNQHYNNSELLFHFRFKALLAPSSFEHKRVTTESIHKP